MSNQGNLPQPTQAISNLLRVHQWNTDADHNHEFGNHSHRLD